MKKIFLTLEQRSKNGYCLVISKANYYEFFNDIPQTKIKLSAPITCDAVIAFYKDVDKPTKHRKYNFQSEEIDSWVKKRKYDRGFRGQPPKLLFELENTNLVFIKKWPVKVERVNSRKNKQRLAMNNYIELNESEMDQQLVNLIKVIREWDEPFSLFYSFDARTKKLAITALKEETRWLVMAYYRDADYIMADEETISLFQFIGLAFAIKEDLSKQAISRIQIKTEGNVCYYLRP